LSLFPALQNRLLASLPASEMSALAPHLSFIDLPQETVLFETGDTIRHVYFPHSGIVSLLVNFASGEMIETAMVGRDSLVGGLAALNEPISLSKAVVQVAGYSSPLPACRTKRLLPRHHHQTSTDHSCSGAAISCMQCHSRSRSPFVPAAFALSRFAGER
jgi:CRP-like cAMP-binding protein